MSIPRSRFVSFRAIRAAAVAALAFVAAGAARGASDECKFDLKNVDSSSTCLRSMWCGGAHGSTLTYHGLTIIGTANGGSADCCLTEIVIHAHTDTIAGDKKIVHLADVQGALITRRCSSPFILFGLELGSWTCETDSVTPFGKYSIDRAQSCD